MARTPRTGASEAVIGKTTRVRGRVSGDGDLVVEGLVDGTIAVQGDLTIAEGGRVTSDVEAAAVTLRGELEGDVKASGLVRIEAGARLRGDITADAFALEEGAELVGRIDAQFDLPSELGPAAVPGGRRR